MSAAGFEPAICEFFMGLVAILKPSPPGCFGCVSTFPPRAQIRKFFTVAGTSHHGILVI